MEIRVEGIMTDEEHAQMLSDLITYLNQFEIGNYRTEYPIKLDSAGHMGNIQSHYFSLRQNLPFDVKSDSKDFTKDIQQIKRYSRLLVRGIYSVHPFILYDVSVRERLLKVINIFQGITLLFFDENRSVVDAKGKELE